ncbi:DUF1648 domain-containing protein [Paenibacillus peoriae]|uniref:DUF1648 domain-containing protein n=1 Tax=Paenibacillus peoriae TaxID=59893 RepID=UPI0032AFF3D3
MKKNTEVYIVVGLIVITLLINIIAYPYLPDQVGIHQRSGNFDNYISKLGFLVVLPSIQIIGSVLTKLTGKTTITLILLNVVALITDIVLIFINI